MPEARFVLKEPKSTEKTLVYLFYRYNTQVLKYSTGEKIYPKFWNPEKQRARDTAKYAEASEFNQRLNNIETGVNISYRRLINNGTIVTKEILKKELNRELLKEELVEKQVDFILWLKEEIKNAGISQKPGSIQVYNALVNHLTNFAEIKRYKLSFESIDFDFYNKFSNYLKAQVIKVVKN